jgi:CysZ protein
MTDDAPTAPKPAPVRTDGLTSGNVFSRFAAGFRAPFRGIKYLFQHKQLLLYALPPVLVTMSLIAVSWWVGIGYTDTILEAVWDPQGEEWYTTWLLKPLWWVVYLITLLVVLTMGTVLSYLASIPVAGPIFELLSEKVEAIETGFDAPFNLRVMIRNILTTALHVSMFFLIQVVVFVLVLLIQWIPVVGQVIGTIVSAITSPLLVGFVPFDYPTTIRLWTFRQKLTFIFRHFSLFFGFSVAALVLLYVPLVNLLFMPACIVAATLIIIEMERSGELAVRDRRKEILSTVEQPTAIALASAVVEDVELVSEVD